MSRKIKKALKKKKEAVDINATIPDDEKIIIGGMNLNGTKKAQKPKTKPKDTAPIETTTKVSINFEDVKKQFANVFKVSSDAYGFTSLKDPETGAVMTYLVSTRQGISHYTKHGNNWRVSDRFTSQKEIDTLFEQLVKEISARKSWADALIPKYVHGNFVTIDKSVMVEHLKALL